MLQDEAALDWLHMMALISQECASRTLPYGSKPDYIMETVPSVQFRSWSLLVSRHTQKVEAFVLHRHDLVFRRWGRQLPIQQQMRFNALEPLFGGEVLGQAARTEHLTLQTKHVPQKVSK